MFGDELIMIMPKGSIQPNQLGGAGSQVKVRFIPGTLFHADVHDVLSTRIRITKPQPTFINTVPNDTWKLIAPEWLRLPFGEATAIIDFNVEFIMEEGDKDGWFDFINDGWE